MSAPCNLCGQPARARHSCRDGDIYAHVSAVDALKAARSSPDPADLTDAALAAAHSYHRVRAHRLRLEIAIREATRGSR